jgi:two-component system, NarL family, invasion response regulator UvrY
MRILIVDDHSLVREGIRRFLTGEIEGSEFGEAASSPEALDRVRDEEWDVVMLDLSLPGRTGLETLKDIHALRPNLPVLVLTMYAEEQYGLRAFRAGAAGFITKESALSELVAAVRKVAGGGKYVTPSIAEKLATNIQDAAGRPPDEALSDRELQVLRMLGSGKTVKDIGVELALSVKTVSTYRTRILQKLRMRTTAELIRYVVARNLD